MGRSVMLQEPPPDRILGHVRNQTSTRFIQFITRTSVCPQKRLITRGHPRRDGTRLGGRYSFRAPGDRERVRSHSYRKRNVACFK